MSITCSVYTYDDGLDVQLVKTFLTFQSYA